MALNKYLVIYKAKWVPAEDQKSKHAVSHYLASIDPLVMQMMDQWWSAL